MDRNYGIGVFDSGVGGLTVMAEINKLLPNEKIYYFGDTAHVPYGDKTPGQVYQYVKDIIEFLKTKKIKALVMACNTSSAIVLPRLNGEVRGIPTLGVIEFASRQALETTRNGKIGVVANPLTVSTGAYPENIKHLSLNGTKVFQKGCPRWVPLIEAGRVTGKDVEDVVAEDLKPLIQSDIDTLIMGCTHYPFMMPTISKVINHRIQIINPASALSLKLKEILQTWDMLSDQENPCHRFFVSGDPHSFQRVGEAFYQKPIPTVERIIL